MNIGNVITRLIREYDKVKDDKRIRKPLAKALHNTWLWADTYEKERKNVVDKTN